MSVKRCTCRVFSLTSLVIMMADRGISLAHTTILRWVQHYLREFEKRWQRYARSVGGSWRMDETYIGPRTMGLPLPGGGTRRAERSISSWVASGMWMRLNAFRKAMKSTRKPKEITLGAYAPSHRAVREMKEEGNSRGK